MKKLISAILAAMTLITAAAAVAADNEPSVYLNGEQLTFDVNPFIENDRTLVPMRAIFEAIGAEVQWDEEKQTVYSVRTDSDGTLTLVSLQIGNDTAFLNSESVTLDVPAKIVDDRTFVPLRFVVEALGETVTWDEANYAVLITTD